MKYDSREQTKLLVSVVYVRRFGERGIDDAVGMKLSGHKSMKIYFDYKAIGKEDLIEASKKLSELTRQPKYSQSKPQKAGLRT